MGTVPTLGGKSFSDASKVCKDAGFKIREKAVDEANADTKDGGLRFNDQAAAFRPKNSGAASGTVISQDPPPGCERADGFTVDVTLADGEFAVPVTPEPVAAVIAPPV